VARSNIGRFTHVHRRSLHEPWYAFISGGTVVGAWLSSQAQNLWDQGVVNPDLGQSAQLPGSAPQNLLITPQAPDPGATNATNGTPGSLLVQLAAPVNGGAVPYFEVSSLASGGSGPLFYMGYNAGIGSGCLWTTHYYEAPAVGNFSVGGSASVTLLNSAGNVYIMQNGYQYAAAFQGSTASMQLCGPTLSLGGGTGVIGVTNCSSSPSTNPSGGGVLYAAAGAGTWRGSSGTVTTFGPAEPHCPVCGKDFVTEHYNERYGYLSVCLSCLADHIGDQPYLIRDKSKRSDKPTVKHPGKGSLLRKAHASAVVAATIGAILSTIVSHLWR
jgi:hypothetical protein